MPPSTRRKAFVTTTVPPISLVNALRIRSGVAVPALDSSSLLTPANVKLLIVIVVAKLPAVVASMVTVLLAALVMKIPDWLRVGATPSDQLAPTSHLPSAGLM